MRGADFTGANLNGANLSEAKLDNALFYGTCMINAVLCESTLTGAQFIDTGFGATLMDAATLDYAHFSGLGAFSLDFTGVRSMRHCRFLNPCGTPCPMTRPPVVIHGLSRVFVIMDRHIKIGHAVYDAEGSSTTLSWPGTAIASPVQFRLRLEQAIAAARAKAA